MDLFNPLDSRVIPLDCLQLSRMANSYQDGMSSRNLADAYGISQKAVLRRLRAMGVKIRRMGVSSIAATSRAAKSSAFK